MVIAIDGPAGAGKSTIARLLANELGFIYLDTGALYRALTLKALHKEISFSDEDSLIQLAAHTDLDLSNNPDKSIKVILDGRDVSGEIRSPAITQHVSDLAKIKGVRDALLKTQRQIGLSHDSVIDGRDIGTVVFPEARKKFFLDASFITRAERRFKELKEKGINVTQKEVERDLRNRDSIDSTRNCAPLKQAEDAIYIDSTNMTIQEVLNKLLGLIS